MKKLLIIDDEPGHRLMVRAIMEDAGWVAMEAESGEEGVSLFQTHYDTVAVALVDMKMPGMNGQQTLTELHKINPALPVILLTAYGTVGSAVEAMKQGAFDYLTKPADNDELVLTLNRAWEYSRLLQENNRLRTELSGESSLSSIIGNSKKIRQVQELIRQAGPSEATVLITGESGTGKELIVDALHAASSRHNYPLIKVNCAALPGQLLESELFGYEKGAFTGAMKNKPGRFQLASGGTLFLDEVGEIPLDLQAKLLRALQERVIEPLGSVKSRPVDVRILAATNRNLNKAVANGTFREDLYFRLNVLEITSPPLREHLEDLPLLVMHLLQRLSQKNKKNIRGVSPGFLHMLSQYTWPGNVRELENILERALILSRADVLEPGSLPPSIIEEVNTSPKNTPTTGFKSMPGINLAGNLMPGKRLATEGTSYTNVLGRAGQEEMSKDTFTFSSADNDKAKPPAMQPLEEVEYLALMQALKLHNGHREKTADSLGISRRTLQYKLKKFGLHRRS